MTDWQPFDALEAIETRANAFEWVSRYRDIAEALGINEASAKALAKPLIEQELICRVPAFDDDGHLVGSGFLATTKGIIALEKWKDDRRSSSETPLPPPPKEGK